MIKKKIVIVHHSGLLGGAGLSLFFLWKELLKHYDVTCYIPIDPPELYDFLKEKGLNPKLFNYRLGKITYYSGGNSALNLKFWYHSLRIIKHKLHWNRILKIENPDLVIVNSIVLCWFSLFSNKYKLMCFVRETIRGKRNNMINKLFSYFLNKFSLVSFLSNYDKNLWDLNYSKSIVAYDFMNYADYKKNQNKVQACIDLNINPKSFNVLFVGGFNRIKGTEIMVKSLKFLKGDNISLVIAGNNPGLFSFNSLKEVWKSIIYLKNKKYYQKIIKIISNVLENKNVFYIGVQKQIRKAFDASDILVVSMTEPHQARPVFEFGCQKKPVIITDFPNIKDFVKNNYNGLTFIKGDEFDLSKKIRILRNNEKLRNKLGKNNYKNAMQNHERKVVIKKLVKSINDLLIIYK